MNNTINTWRMTDPINDDVIHEIITIIKTNNIDMIIRSDIELLAKFMILHLHRSEILYNNTTEWTPWIVCNDISRYIRELSGDILIKVTDKINLE